MLRYFPTQALNFAFKDNFKKMFNFKKNEGFSLWVFGTSTVDLIQLPTAEFLTCRKRC